MNCLFTYNLNTCLALTLLFNSSYIFVCSAFALYMHMNVYDWQIDDFIFFSAYMQLFEIFDMLTRCVARHRQGSLGFNIIWALTRETLTLLLANNKVTDPMRKLISTFVIRYLKSKVTRSNIFKFSFFLVVLNMIKSLATPLLTDWWFYLFSLFAVVWNIWLAKLVISRSSGFTHYFPTIWQSHGFPHVFLQLRIKYVLCVIDAMPRIRTLSLFNKQGC